MCITKRFCGALMIFTLGTVVLILLASILACRSDKNIPDVSDIEIAPQLVRFEKNLFEADTQNLTDLVDVVSTEYPDFADVYLYQIINDPSYGRDITRSLKAFLTDSLVRTLHRDAASLYDPFTPYLDDLTQALRYHKYYFPDDKVPDIYTCITGFEVGSFTIGDAILGIGLDFYLGNDYPHYNPQLFPAYIARGMTSDYLVPKTIQALVANKMGEVKGTTLLAYMIHNGIELYIKEMLLPNESEAVIYEYSDAQINWLHENESQIWAHLIQEELLHSVKYRSFQKLVSPSPNIPNMPAEAPGRLGNWIGAQIVKSFVNRQPQTTLTELINLRDDPQKILTESKYKPRQ